MASITTKINDFLHSPKTREMVDKAKTAATNPENRQKIKQMQEKIASRTRGHGQHTPAPGSPDPNDVDQNPSSMPTSGYETDVAPDAGRADPGARPGS
ncbi:conserved hypothetical protein [Frankia sp. AiPs1]|uniref:hypothetical protein n=1 Tax=Frankia sp. AiPa1 TaxID=573492 RepID=UPI00202B0071|nr:hypothetical protein [Frankia sp. AiPa1]MCL9757870.1 hypothetical protein [Frankia sp. AiPa1]